MCVCVNESRDQTRKDGPFAADEMVASDARLHGLLGVSCCMLLLYLLLVASSGRFVFVLGIQGQPHGFRRVCTNPLRVFGSGAPEVKLQVHGDVPH